MSKETHRVGSEKGKLGETASNWHPKPGDKIVRPRRVKHQRLRRVLGVFSLFSAGYGNVGSSIYYALGIVALVAMGATPIALGIAGIFFILIALSYAEGSAMFPEAGGSASFARHGFNNLTGFTAGWALMLSYIVTIAISAFVIPPYLGHFWPILKESSAAGTTLAMGIVFFLMVINVIGVRETSFLNVAAAVLDLTVQVLIIVLGLLFLFSPAVLIERITLNWPGWQNLVIGVALAAIAYTGVETMSQMAEETRQPEKRVPRALILMTITVLILFTGISTVAFSTMTPQELVAKWATDPVAGIAASLSMNIQPGEVAARWTSDPTLAIVLAWMLSGLLKLLPPLVAILAATILLIATNAGLMGISRLAFSLGRYKLVPTALNQVHPRFKTPYISIILFAVVALLLLTPGFFTRNFFAVLGTLYAFGSLLSFAIAHASILALRARMADLPRPFKIGGNIRVKGKEMPLTAIAGLLITVIVWMVVVITQPYSRLVGFSWMALGLIVYALPRWRRRRTPQRMVGEAGKTPVT